MMHVSQIIALIKSSGSYGPDIFASFVSQICVCIARWYIQYFINKRPEV